MHVHICTCIWVSVFVHFMLARERALIRAYAGVCTRVLALLTLLAVSLESGLGGWTQAAMVGKLAGWLDLQGDELQAALGPAGRAREEGTGVRRSWGSWLLLGSLRRGWLGRRHRRARVAGIPTEVASGKDSPAMVAASMDVWSATPPQGP